MKVFAYCAQSFYRAARRAAGVEPVTCPPVTADEFDPRWLERKDLLYFDLHGAPGRAEWYGDGGVVALRAEQVARSNLAGCVVFALNCYLADADSPMLDALLEAGARYVIGGDGRNWAGDVALLGAGLMGFWVRRLLELGAGPLLALSWAKDVLKVTLARDMVINRRDSMAAARDALGFRAYCRKHGQAV